MCRVPFGIIVIVGILLCSMPMAPGIRSLFTNCEIMMASGCHVDTYTGLGVK